VQVAANEYKYKKGHGNESYLQREKKQNDWLSDRGFVFSFGSSVGGVMVGTAEWVWKWVCISSVSVIY